jgi:hypothetical protein
VWFFGSSQIIPGIELFECLPVPLEPCLRGCNVDAELHQALTVARDFKVIARVRVLGQPGKKHVDIATIYQGADGEVVFDGIHNQEHAVSPCLGWPHGLAESGSDQCSSQSFSQGSGLCFGKPKT